MKLIIAGSRHLNPSRGLIDYLLSFHGLNDLVTEVVCGGAKGVDNAGRVWCQEIRGLCGPDSVKLVEFPAEWDKYQGRAGPIRNNKMAVYGDVLLLIWDGESSGSKHMKSAMMELNKPIYEIIIRNHNEKK